VTLQRSDNAASPASVRVYTRAGTALAGEDYAAFSSIVSFLANERIKTVSIGIIDDARHEGSEAFSIVLSQPNGTAIVAPDVLTVTIHDNDPPAPTVRPARVTAVTPVFSGSGRRRALGAVRLVFSEPMAAAQAAKLAWFRLKSAGRDGVLDTADDRRVAVRRVTYNPRSRATTLQLARSIRGRFLLEIWASGQGLRSAGGVLIDGDGDGRAGGDFRVQIGA
jgi:hypothetical protein